MARISMVVGLLVTIALSPRAEATITDSNDPALTSYQSADLKNITSDSETGLDWLDIDTATNISYNTMLTLLGVGELASFRYATLPEVDIFFNHLGVPTTPLLSGHLDTLDPGGALFDAARGHTGWTYYEDPTRSAMGLTSTDGLVPATPKAPFFLTYENSGVTTLHTFAVEYYRTDARQDLGSWLVRDTIFDPADTDKDGDVDTADLTAMFQNFTGDIPGGAGGKTMADGDTDMDGDVDTADLTAGFQQFTGDQSAGLGGTSLVATVPEPSSLALAALGLAG